MSVTWWEKTVEYNFVTYAKKKYGLNLLAPLDGNVESGGDLIAGNPDRYFIIEFKKEKNSFNSEYKKFLKGKEGYDEAKQTLQNDKKSTFHYLIYGSYNEGANELSLVFSDYFDIDNSITHNNEKDYFQNGISRDELNKYLLSFSHFKNIDNDSDSNGDSSGPSKSIILAIENDKVQTITVEYYARNALKIKPVQKNDDAIKNGSSTPKNNNFRMK
ncbi:MULTISPECIES: hypothetical protein [Providencia]|uniref:hypothetical protein n=1 Tax=Providencia TaxID=586 RepID=UPI001ED9268E|nr:hypothetical protein [Providencia rettgeri]UIX51209.1 hypothetical protein [Providencia rettgeri]